MPHGLLQTVRPLQCEARELHNGAAVAPLHFVDVLRKCMDVRRDVRTVVTGYPERVAICRLDAVQTISGVSGQEIGRRQERC
jgi:hypothetical protein